MEIKQSQNCNCDTTPESTCCCTPSSEMFPIHKEPPTNESDAPCCGPPPEPPSSPHERAGFALYPFVETFITTPAGPVPRVKTKLSRNDRWNTLGVRLDMGRNNYKVAPGLYAVGDPDNQSPVLVTANY